MKLQADELEPAWMRRARSEIGVKERPGSHDHPRIIEYLQATRITPKLHHDETAWCSAFACWVMEGEGIASTRSAAARSWLTWGEELAEPRIGAIVVLSRGPNPAHGHVGFYAGEEGGQVLVLGGNQRNAVCVAPYPKGRVLSYRWPVLP